VPIVNRGKSLSLREAARVMGCSLASVQRLVARNVLHSSHGRVPSSAVEAYRRRVREPLVKAARERPRQRRHHLPEVRAKRTRTRGPPRLSLPVLPRLDRDDQVHCDRFDATIPVWCCLQRQAAKWPSKQAPLYDFCGSGNCEQGKGFKRRTSYSPAVDWASHSKTKSPNFQFFRKDAGAQRQKRRLFVFQEYPVPSLDVPPGYVTRMPMDSPMDDLKVALAR